MKKKLLALILSVAVVASIAAAGTLAYLTSTPDAVENTFTIGNISIDLKEHEYKDGALTATEVNKNTYEKILPGQTLPKDPFVRMNVNSEASYVYVAVENGLGQYGTLNIDQNAWAVVQSYRDFTIYSYIGKNATNQVVGATGDNSVELEPVFTTVTIDKDITSADVMNSLNGAKINVYAFAIQADGLDSSADATTQAMQHFMEIANA